LEKSIRLKENVYKLPYWKPFIESVSFKNLEHFLVKEEIIVKHEMDNSEKFAQNSNESLLQLVKVYCDAVLALLKKDELDEKNRPEWIHINHLLDVVHLDQVMTKDFDFKHYYCEYGKFEMKELVEFTKKNIIKIWFILNKIYKITSPFNWFKRSIYSASLFKDFLMSK